MSGDDDLAVLLRSRWGLKSWGPTGYNNVARWSPTKAGKDRFVIRLAVCETRKNRSAVEAVVAAELISFAGGDLGER